MRYHQDLPGLLRDLRSKEDSKASILVYHDESLDPVFRDVITQGGGGEKDLVWERADYVSPVNQYDPFLKGFVDFLTELVITEPEEIEKKDHKKYAAFMRFAAQRYWARILHLDLSKTNAVLKRLQENPALEAEIEKKLKEDKRNCNLPLLLSDALAKLKQKIESGEYEGGNVIGFVKTTAWNLSRNEAKKLKGRPGKSNQDLADILLEAGMVDENSPDKIAEFLELKLILLSTFKQLSKRCRHVLYFNTTKNYLKNVTQAYIAKELKYGSVQSMTNKLSKCRIEWRKRYDRKKDQ